MRDRSTTLILALAVLTAVSGCRREASPPPPAETAPTSDLHTPATPSAFAIPGRDNSAVTIATSGATVVLTWAAKGASDTDIYAATSADAGLTFGKAVRVNDVDGDANITGEQPPRAAIHGAEVVVIWPSHLGGASHIRLARSTDAGKTFEKTTTLNPEPLTGARGWASVAFDHDGLVHALWLDGRYAGTSAMPHDHAAMPHDHATAGAGEPADMTMPMHSAAKQALIAATWTAGSAAKETKVAGDVCFCCKTAIAVGPDGALYAAYRNIYPNSIRDIAVARWAPGGDKPAASVRVSKDEWHLEGCPDDGPALFVDAANTLHVVWPTSIDGGAGRKGLFYAFSLDGGRTFSPRQRIDDADEPSNAAHPQIAGAGGRVVVAWDQLAARASGPSQHLVRLRDITNAAAAGRTPAWSPTPGPATVADSMGDSIYPVVAFVPGAELVAWTDPQPGASAIRMYRVAR